MKISDIIQEDLDEGWKSNIAKLGASAALALGSTGPKTPHQMPSELVQTISHSTPARTLADLAVKSGIKGNELAALMSQAAHETSNFTKMTENGKDEYFLQYEIPDQAKILGNVDKNGNVIPGSGKKYRGRGHLHITGKYNYKIIGKALNLPLEKHPELLEDPEIGAKASLWYWKHRVVPKVKNFDDIYQVTRTINSKLKGMDSRIDYARKIKTAVWPPPEKP